MTGTAIIFPSIYVRAVRIAQLTETRLSAATLRGDRLALKNRVALPINRYDR